MDSRYKLSVVVLVYKTEEYLRECLDSLVNQTLKDIEIIIVNDGSPDDSHIIIEEYERQYNNIKVINQENSGGAIAGNKGMKIASGDYITVMDSDDVVPLDAYEKLYNKAVESNAEIVIGKPHILVNGVQKEVIYKKERDVWKKERDIESLLDFPDIFYDGFYWNKIYKRDFIFKHDCFMPPGMLYADRPMVHKAFLYANKISIITDVVYLWRKREEDSKVKSITQMKSDIGNFLDRIASLYYQIDYFDDFGDELLKSEFLKRNIDRLFFPISAIVDDLDFRKVYLKEVKQILNRINDVYENDVGIRRNLFIYMILNDLIKELIYYLKTNPTGKIMEEDGKYYWCLPYFRDESVGIPDELFQIKTLIESFIKVDSMAIDNGVLKIDNVKVPEVISIDQVIVQFESAADVNDCLFYELEQKDFNSFSLDIPLSEFHPTTLYNVYFVFYYQNKEEQFRLTKTMLPNYNKNHTLKLDGLDYRLFIKKNKKLYLQVTDFEILDVRCDHHNIRITTSDTSDDVLSFYLKERGVKGKIYFQNTENGQYELKWEYFLDKYAVYDLYFESFNYSFRLGLENIVNLTAEKVSIEGMKMELYITDKNNISLRTFTLIDETIRKLKGAIKRVIK